MIVDSQFNKEILKKLDICYKISITPVNLPAYLLDPKAKKDEDLELTSNEKTVALVHAKTGLCK